MKGFLTIGAILLGAAAPEATAFQPARAAPSFQTASRQTTSPVVRRMAEEEAAAETEEPAADDVEAFLSSNYPEFHSLLSKNPGLFNEIADASNGYTLFVPSAAAFADLGEKKLRQIEDPRNLETAQKLGLYHVISTEPVSSMRLRTEDYTKPRPKDGSPQPLTIGGVATMGGEVPVGRKKSGGFLGFGAKEDGSIVVGPEASIVQSNNIGKSIVHEVDAFVSPIVLWRYFDQLQIGRF